MSLGTLLNALRILLQEFSMHPRRLLSSWMDACKLGYTSRLPLLWLGGKPGTQSVIFFVPDERGEGGGGHRRTSLMLTFLLWCVGAQALARPCLCCGAISTMSLTGTLHTVSNCCHIKSIDPILLTKCCQGQGNIEMSQAKNTWKMVCLKMLMPWGYLSDPALSPLCNKAIALVG